MDKPLVKPDEARVAQWVDDARKTTLRIIYAPWLDIVFVEMEAKHGGDTVVCSAVGPARRADFVAMLRETGVLS